MEDYKNALLVLQSILLGMVSGFISGNYYFGTFDSFLDLLPGFCFGITVCIMFKFLLKAHINILRFIIFIISSIISFYLAFSEKIPSSFLDFPFIAVGVSGLIYGIGICISFVVFKINLSLKENLILIIVSILTSFTFFIDVLYKLFNVLTPLNFIAWQGAMIGYLAYFTIRKMQKENELKNNTTPKIELVK